MASLTISTNWIPSVGAPSLVHDLLLHLSRKVAAVAQIAEDELMVEIRLGQHLVFAKSTDLAAHCLWAAGSPLDKWQNSELHKTVSHALESHLAISATRVRITRVQLYEILDLNSQLEASSRPPTSATSPRSTTSPRGESPRKKGSRKEESKEKKGWSKSLEKKKAAELTAAKARSVAEERSAAAAVYESDSSEKSGTQLLDHEA